MIAINARQMFAVIQSHGVVIQRQSVKQPMETGAEHIVHRIVVQRFVVMEFVMQGKLVHIVRLIVLRHHSALQKLMHQ